MKEKKNRKKLFLTLGLLFGLAGVGTAAFAGYVIGEQTKEDSITNKPGDIVIANNSLSVEGTIGEGETLLFYPKDKVTGKRLNYDGKPEQKLSLNLTVNITGGAEGLASIVGDKIRVTISDGGVGQAITDDYIDAPTVSDVAITEETSYLIPLDFGFGGKFGNTDPCSYFNGEAGSSVDLGTPEDTGTETVWGIMNDFETSLANTTITIGISVVDAA